MALSEKLLPNWDFVGRCYDVLTVDPLNIEAGTKFPVAFFFPAFDPESPQGFDPIKDGSAYKPSCTEHIPATGGTQNSSTTSMSSTYDFQQFSKLAGSVSVSDPTGSLFGTTLSSSFSQTQNEIESSSKVVTYSQQRVNRYKLAMRLDYPDIRVSADLDAAVAALPTSRADTYREFLERFGTHYAHAAGFGGRVYQRLTVQDAEYSRFLEDGLNVEAEANLTFEIAKGSVKGSREDRRSQKFVNATKSSTNAIVFAGGTPQEGFDSWATTVADRPAPIEIDLRPLYTLLTRTFFPTDADIQTKQAVLKDEIENYIRSHGRDVRQAVLHYGDQIAVSAEGATGVDRYLSAAKPSYVQTARPSAAGTPGSDASLRWAIVHADDPTRTGEVRAGDIVALRSVRDNLFLDAQAGTDQMYSKGDGLTAAKSPDTRRPAARWKVGLAGNRARTELVDGDFVRFASQWQDPDGNFGYLMSEVNPQDAAQRVYAFGKASARGTLWRCSRLSR